MESSGKSGSEDIDRIEIDVLVIGKKVHLSFAEMNELTLSELFNFVKSYTGSKEKKATQADIDQFFA